MSEAITPHAVQIGSGSFWSFVAVGGLSFVALLSLALGLILIGYTLFGPDREMKNVWTGGVVALGFVVWFGSMVRERFTDAARIEIDASGVWTLRSPVGRIVAQVPAGTERTLSFWLRASSASAGSRRRDALRGFILVDGRRHNLEESKCFSILEDLGYGPWVIHFTDISERDRDRRRAVVVPRDADAPFRLPPHRYDADGIATVRAHLDRAASP